VGWLLSSVANSVLGQFDFVLSLSSVFLAVLMAVGTGLIFGIYPAQKAASLSPMEALRFE
jgi:putative ABC transport system permease protein